MTMQRRRTPEAEHLAEQERLLEELTDQLTAKEAEFAETGSAFARFRAEYLRRFAPLYVELDRLEAEIARRIAHEEATPAAHAKAAAASARAEESQKALGDGLAADAPDETGPAAAAPELKALYRDAAKRIHPDLATDEAENHTKRGASPRPAWSPRDWPARAVPLPVLRSLASRTSAPSASSLSASTPARFEAGSDGMRSAHLRFASRPHSRSKPVPGRGAGRSVDIQPSLAENHGPRLPRGGTA